MTLRALSEAKGYPLRAFGLCFGAYTFSQMDLALFGYALPAIRQEFDLEISDLGWIISASFLLGGVILVALSSLADRIGRHLIFQGSVVISSIFIVLQAIATGPIMLTLFRGLGIGTGGLQYPITAAIVAEEMPSRIRGLFAGFLQVGYPLGWAIASFVAAPVVAHFGWRAIFLIGFISVPYVFVVRKYMKEPARFKEARKKRAMRGNQKTSILELFSRQYRYRSLVLFFAQFMFVMAYAGSAFLMATYFADARGMPLTNSILLVGIGNGIGIFGYLLAAYVGEFILTRRTTIIIWTLAGTLAFLWLIWFTNGLVDSLIAFGVMSMFFYGTAAVKSAFIAEVFPTHIRATGIAVCGSFAVALGTAVGPNLVTQAVGTIGWNLAMTYFVAIPLSLAGFLYLLLKPIPSGLEVEEVDRLMSEKHIRQE